MCPALPWTKQSKGGRKEPKAPAPSRKGLLPSTIDQAVPKPGWLKQGYTFLFKLPHLPQLALPSTQNEGNLQSVHDPSQGQGGRSPQGPGDRRVCHLAAFCFPSVLRSPQCVPTKKPHLFLFPHGPFQMLILQNKERENSGPEEWTPSPSISLSQLGPRTSSLTGLTSVWWILICQVGIITRKHSL